MKKWIFLITIPFILSVNIAHAEQLATTLKGKILNNNPAEIEVFITENDGSILDMTSLSDEGIYQLDLTIMDTPSQYEVKKLILEVKSKSGVTKKYRIIRYIKSFDDVVLMRPIAFN